MQAVLINRIYKYSPEVSTIESAFILLDIYVALFNI